MIVTTFVAAANAASTTQQLTGCNLTPTSNHFSVNDGGTVLACDAGYSLLYGDSLTLSTEAAHNTVSVTPLPTNASTAVESQRLLVTGGRRTRPKVPSPSRILTQSRLSPRFLPTFPQFISTQWLNRVRVELVTCCQAASVFSERLSRFYGTRISVSPQNFMCEGTPEFNSTIQMYPGCSGGVAYDVLDSLRDYPGQLTARD